MNPLSALRPVASPELNADMLAKPGSLGGPISARDLEQLTPQTATTSSSAASAANGFSSYLGRLVGEVGTQQNVADAAVNGLLSGQNVSLHQAMIAMEEASVSFQLMVEVRNRLLDSYQELMRMQV